MIYLELPGVSNKVVVTPTIFPDGTSQVWNVPHIDNLPEEGNVIIVWDFESEAELMHLTQLTALIAGNVPRDRLYLVIPYLPYARQDKEISNSTSFAYSIFDYFLQGLEVCFAKIYTSVKHNPEFEGSAVKNIIECSCLLDKEKFSEFLDTRKFDTIVFPDNGAYMRFKAIREGFNEDYNMVVFEKIRDQHTGNILGIHHVGGVIGKRCLIVDDICDGGKTFIEVAKYLKEVNVNRVELFVSNGIFSKGISTLYKNGIDTVWCEHHLRKFVTESLEVIKGDVVEAFKSHEGSAVLIHGCNLSGGFGSGVAGAIRKQYPHVADDYFSNYMIMGMGEPRGIYAVHNSKLVVNMATQKYYGKDAKEKQKTYLDYNALESGLYRSFKMWGQNFDTIFLPKIGCGLAGGEWEAVEEIIYNTAVACGVLNKLRIYEI